MLPVIHASHAIDFPTLILKACLHVLTAQAQVICVPNEKLVINFVQLSDRVLRSGFEVPRG